MKKSFLRLHGVLFTSIVLLEVPVLADRFLFGPPVDPEVERRRLQEQQRITSALEEQARERNEEAARRLAERQAMTPEAVAARAKERQIKSIVAKAGPHAFRRYSDGTVASLALVLCIREGLLEGAHPKCRYLENLVLIEGGYTVKANIEGGCIVVPLRRGPRQPQEEELFVDGLNASSNQEQSDMLMLRRNGNYRYTTSQGARRKIHKFETGERATQEEYVAFWRQH